MNTYFGKIVRDLFGPCRITLLYLGPKQSTMAKLTIEKSTNLDKVIRKVWVNMAVTATCSGFTLQDSREYIVSTFQQWLPSTVTVGAGGSHVWISDSENNRIAIITF